LDEQAINALKQWKFEPGTLKGKPVAVRVRVEMEFNLRRSREEAKQ
jgi:TonB family protein